ncbi:helix-turn-helix transcriptional regulator [Corallococcus macrosporus]|uniref:Helix-turn-helix transcriptional regulator n=1 Tax=Corallococcus macrosporus TaxID=35 RepID=A0ABS3D4S1_9BACT|nr:AraC family transcriptional regulator [Corallococcus macrosporus]MBN8226065.1 helix-turn-helix transcriptional regulator [Corallococcus macrosporus]
MSEAAHRPLFHLRRAFAGSRVGRGPKHANQSFELTWVQQGHIQFDLGRSTLDAAAGTCVVLTDDGENTPVVRAAVLHQLWLPGTWLEEAAGALGPRASVPRFSAVHPADSRLTAHIRLVMEEIESGVPASDPGLGALMDSLLYGLVRGSAPERQHRQRDARIQRALERIAGEYADALRVEDLAEAAGMCRYSFLRAFRASVGESPYQYLQGFRLERAAERIRLRRDASVLETALACGFGDPGRFARAFRARFGCAPREYRARHSG